MANPSLATRLQLGFLVSLVGVGVLISLIIAQEPPVGFFAGRVMAKETGKPIPGAKVSLSGVISTSAKTDSAGEFQFRNLPIGKYTAEVCSTAHHLPQVKPAGPPEIEIKEGETTKLDFVLHPISPYFNLYLHRQVFTPKDKILLHCEGFVPEGYMGIEIYKIDWQRFLFQQGRMSPEYEAYETRKLNIEALGGRLVKKWAEKLKKDIEGVFNQRIEVPLKEFGTFLISAQAGRLKRWCWLTITELGIITKHSSRQILVYAINLDTGKPVAGTKIRIYRRRDLRASGLTDKNGLLMVNLPAGEREYLIVGQKDSSNAYHHSYHYGSEWESGYKVYMYTDRPIYRPGHRVFFKGIVRRSLNGKYHVPVPKLVNIEVHDEKGTLIYKKELRTNRFGSFFGDFDLLKEASVGWYEIRARIEGRDYFHGFSIAEYRKPEYKIEVAPQKKRYILGDRVKVKVKGEYYFGAPVSNAEVRYYIYKSRYWYYPEFEEEEEFRYYGEEYFEEEERYYGGYGEFVEEGTTKTDENGTATFTFETKKEEKEPELADLKYNIQVYVTDPSRKEAEGRANVLVTRGEFNISLEEEKYIYQPGEPVKLSLRALGYDKKPQKNLEVQIRAGFEEWREGKLRFHSTDSAILRTDKKGRARFVFVPKREGNYKVEAWAYDRRKNKVFADCSLWVTKSEHADMPYRYPDLEIIMDKKVYHKGDVAKIMINTEFAKKTEGLFGSPNTEAKGIFALLTLEGPRIYKYQVLQLKGQTNLLKVPILADYMPNVFLCLSFVKDKHLIRDDVMLRVSPEEHYLKVEVKANKDTYRPRERAIYTIKTTDSQGKPRRAEVSLGVVDESIYALAEDDPKDMVRFFYRLRYNEVETQYSFPEYYYQEEAKEGVPTREVRKYFPDTAYWNPTILTDSQGKAQISFTLPDTLTTWRATARAHTLDTAVGGELSKAVCTKDLLVRLETPRFFTQKDELTISAIVHNYTKQVQKVKVQLKANPLQILSPESKTVEVPRKGMKRIDWQVKVPEVGTSKITVYAQAQSGLYDATELTLPIVPHGIEKRQTASGEVKDIANIQFSLPPDVVAEASECKVSITPTMAGAMVQALDYLSQAYYETTENSVSWFLPDMTVMWVFKDLGIHDRELEKRVPQRIRTCLQRLYNLQHEDGGWSWCQYDQNDPFCTAYVVYGLIQARKAGYYVNENVLRRGIKALSRQLPTVKDESNRALMLYVLSYTNKMDVKAMEDMVKDAKKLQNYAKALLVLALVNAKRMKEAKEVAKELDKTAKEGKLTCWWDETFDWGFYSCNPYETTGYALKALVRVDPNNPKIPKAAHWLVLQRKGNGWMSTEDTASIIYALADYCKLARELSPPNYLAKVYLNGKLIKEVEVTKASMFKDIQVTIDPKRLQKGINQIKLEKRGVGKLYYSAILKYFVKEEDIKAAAAPGLKIKREYFRRILTKGTQGEWKHTIKPLEGAVKSGDEILVKVTVETKDDCRHIVVSDPIPSGCEVVTEPREFEEWPYWYAGKEIRDNRVIFYGSYLNKGKNRFEYVLKAQIPGSYHIMPTNIFCVYIPEIWCISDERRLTIK